MIYFHAHTSKFSFQRSIFVFQALLLYFILVGTAAFAQTVLSAEEIELRDRMANDGASAPMIDRVIQHRRLLQKNVDIRAVNPSGAASHRTFFTASCSDMGGENGWGNWYGAEGNCMSGSTSYPVATNPPPAPYIVLTSGNGIEPCSLFPDSDSIPFVAPSFGMASLRLGEPQVPGFGAERVTFSFLVNPQDTDFTYMYAMVIQDAGHQVSEQPYVSLCIYDAQGNSLPCGCFRYTGGPNMPGFTESPCDIDTYYKPWTVVGVDLTSYVGQTLTVEIENVDCKQGGHYAYSYWDFTCGSILNDAGYYCSGQAANMCVPPDASNLNTYQWFHNGVPVPNGTSTCLQSIPQLGDTFTVTIHPPSGCDFSLAYIPRPFEIYPNFIDFTHCGDVEFMDISTTSVSTLPITSWEWTFPTGNPQTAGAQFPGTITFPPGTHPVTLIVTANNCVDTIQQDFTLYNLPEADFTFSDACYGSPTQLNDQTFSPSGDPVRSWNWYFPTGNPSSSISQNPNIIFNSPGNQNATLIVQTVDGCVDTVQGSVNVHPIPEARFTAPGEGCAPFSMIFQNITQAIADTSMNWTWNFPGGNPSEWHSKYPPMIVYDKPGVYSVDMNATSSFGCSSTLLRDSFVIVKPSPTADFSTSTHEMPKAEPEFSFTHLWSDDVVSWTWDFGDGTSNVADTNPNHDYRASTSDNDFLTFFITLLVENSVGCTDTQSVRVRVLPETTFNIPNTFTPNEDNVNDAFFGKSYGVKEYHISIFDRWGVMVWQCDQAGSNVPTDRNTNEGMASLCQWDGKVGGKQSSQNDVYIYKVQLVDVYDQPHSYTGRVNLLH